MGHTFAAHRCLLASPIEKRGQHKWISDAVGDIHANMYSNQHSWYSPLPLSPPAFSPFPSPLFLLCKLCCFNGIFEGWFNLPIGADDDYIQNFALLLKNGNQWTKPYPSDLPICIYPSSSHLHPVFLFIFMFLFELKIRHRTLE